MSRSTMGISRSTTILLLIAFFICVILPAQGVHAFGAGNIPSFAYLEGKAFRHGDIEDTLVELAKKSGGFGLGALIGSKGPKFGGLDVKRVYFGNWLRDYSQAVDIAGLKKLQLQTIINLCMALGFLAHGYATHEFEVTEERLGVYLPTEHIDNPKGYGEGEDARKYNPKLRGPVDPRELEIDPHTGMKNYIANENGNWDTSKALVRRTLERCVQYGRQARQNGQKQDLYESYRLLGQLLHTLEDFPAHSNFCELALVSMGHNDVFVQVGDQVRVQAPNRKWVAPLVTGTFGSSDFIHSLLGEATDHISQASVTDLNKEFDHARQRSRSGPGSTSSNVDTLRDLLFQLPGGGGGDMAREMDGIERIRAGPAAGGKRPEDLSPQELHAVLWQVLTFRDSVVKKIEKTIEKIPGLGPLIEKIMDSISVFIFTTLEPYLKPLLKTATTGLQAASGEVIDSHDQYEVFNDPRASDPTHSFLSKDHFNLILNEPAGNVAKVIVTYTVQLVVKAWDDTSVNVRQMSEDILECLFHPEFHNPSSTVQRQMLQYMRDWVQSLGHNRTTTLSRLSKESVREHRNIRLAGEGGQAGAVGSAAYNAGVDARHDLQGYVAHIPGVGQAQSLLNQFSGGAGVRRDGAPGSGSGGSVSGSGYGPPSGAPPSGGGYAPPSMSGQAASYYGSGAGGVSSPPPPTGARPQVSSYDHGTPSFPGAPSVGGPGGPPPTYPGASSYNASVPSFPSGVGVPEPEHSSYGGHHGGHGHEHQHSQHHGHGHGQPQPHHQSSGYAPSYAAPTGPPPPDPYSSSPSVSSYAPPPGMPPVIAMPGGGGSYGGIGMPSSYAPPSSGYGASGFPDPEYDSFTGGGGPTFPGAEDYGTGYGGQSQYEPPRGPPPPPPPGAPPGGYYGGGGW